MGNSRKVILPNEAAKPIGPYSPGILAGSYLFASGTIGVDPVTGSLVEGGVEAQTNQALTNLSTVLRAGGCTLGEVVKTTVFMKDLGKFSEMNQVYAGFFPADPPARSMLGATSSGGYSSLKGISIVSSSAIVFSSPKVSKFPCLHRRKDLLAR